jgi:methyltransferase
MLIEARRSSRNERALRARGGIEAPNDVYTIMRVCYPAAFLLMILEGWMRGGPSWHLLVVGLTLFLAAKALKWWAIRSLGPFWTFRVIVVPNATLVMTGPYRYVPHPIYIAVVGEFVAIALTTGALITGPLMTIVFGLLIMRRIAVENAALDPVRGRR